MTRYYRQNGGSYGCRGAYTVHHMVVDDDRVIAYASTHGFEHPATADEAARLGKRNSGYYREAGHPRQAECEAALIAEAESGHGGWTRIQETSPECFTAETISGKRLFFGPHCRPTISDL